MPYSGLRSPRGIQYEDVSQAADALLQEGTRPTIERIRLRLGRGSPNTVSPMLEQWFAGLGQRLGGAGAGAAPLAAGVPDPVMQAAQALWTAANTAADNHAAQAWAARQAVQDGAAQELENARAQLQARELALHERLQAMETALALSTQQLHESNERAKAHQASLTQREQELREQRGSAERSSERLAALQQQLEQVQTQARDERSTIEARHVANERRWLEEVDRARQEARKSALLAQEEARKNAQWQAQADAGTAALQSAHSAHAEQLTAVRQELASAQGQAQQAQALLSELQRQTALARSAPAPALRASAQNAINRPLRPLALRRKLGRKK
jgi:DNA repair exonuclease SbcCD ATPase subunit